MTEQRMDEIERKVFYRHIESIMRTLEQCEDTHIIFQIGMEMAETVWAGNKKEQDKIQNKLIKEWNRQ